LPARVLVPVIRQAIDELLDQEREHAKSEVADRERSLELSVRKARSRRVSAGAGIERRALKNS
jgi:hypothetical protein